MFKGMETHENIYSQFFHSEMDLTQMQTMDFQFQIIMILLHFNPINLMLKYSIIKFKSFTSIIIQTKTEIKGITHERFSF